VASRVGGIPEIADPLLDRLVPAADAGALADAIVEFLTTPRSIAARALPIPTVADAAQQLLEVLASQIRADRQPASIGEASAGAQVADALEVRS
jgi:hypothetical protein